jgi:hypothetical protein
MIDEMTYPAARSGISYERGIDSTWHFSTDIKGGTPGAVNSPSPASLDHSRPGDVLINEVMADARGLTLLPETEYVEIYNASESDISLNGWSFVYSGSDIELPDVVLPVGSYAVLYRARRPMDVPSDALLLGISNFPSALASTGRTIGLKNVRGVMIDEIAYPTARAGISYERGTDGTWHFSTDAKGGTPGAMNSPSPASSDTSRPGDVLINEVMADARGLTLLPETEYIEIHNVSGSDLSLNSWAFVYSGNDTELPDVILPAGGYAVLYRAERTITADAGALLLGIDNFPSTLANTGRTIGLKNARGVTIDEMTYPAARSGISYERGADGTWHFSTDVKGGTPGTINSPSPASLDHSRPGDVLINEVMADAGGLTLLPETEYVEIYNTSGSDISLNGWSFV